jgi:hypothetical protein
MTPDAATASATEDPWMRCMRCREFAAAWAISDAALRARAGVPCWHWPRHLQYIWDGTPLEGKRVLIRCYHGLVDTVQFIRYAPFVKRVAREVVVWAQPALLPLLRSAAVIDRLLPLHDGRPDVEYDVDFEIMELAHVFRSTLATLPVEVPYLHAPSATLPPTRMRRVGLVWSAGGWDERRSVPAGELAPLLACPGVEFHVLQRGAASRELPFGPAHCDSGSDNVETLASVMRALDLVITVDSFPAHLAGALGVRTWTLLHAEPDWRWMVGREDSPWYPTMRLFRQTSPGNWPGVFESMRTVLNALG